MLYPKRWLEYLMLSLSLGPLALSTSHLILLLALGFALWVARRCAPLGSRGQSDGVLFWLFLLALVVARLGFVGLYWAQYREAPWQMVDIRDGGFVVWLGVITGILTIALRGWRVPAQRRALGLASAVGLALWLGGTGLLHWQRGESRIPEQPLATAQGARASLTRYQGQPLVVNLWASWCPPCRREMPALVAAQHQHPGVRFVYVNQGETLDTAAAFLGASGVNMSDVLFDTHGALMKEVGAMALPTTLFYGADGRLLGSHLGALSPASLEQSLEVFAP
jgi:thiol-disulfide isomerase/thioredoxin